MAEEKGLASALIEAGVNMLTQSPFTTTTPSELHRIAATIEAIAKEHDRRLMYFVNATSKLQLIQNYLRELARMEGEYVTLDLRVCPLSIGLNICSWMRQTVANPIYGYNLLPLGKPGTRWPTSGTSRCTTSTTATSISPTTRTRRRWMPCGAIPSPIATALGPQEGRKAYTLQTVPAFTDYGEGVIAKAAGVSLHAGVAARADGRSKLESQGQGVALLGAPRMQRYAATSPAPPFPPSGCH